MKIRDNKRFDSLDELKQQIIHDCLWVEEHPQIVITF